MHHEYPKWKYHQSDEAQVVDDPGQEEALGHAWHDTPTAAAETPRQDQKHVPAAEPVTEPEPKRRRASRAA